VRPELIALGFPKCLVTPSTFMCRSPVRRAARNVSRSPPLPSDGCGHELGFWFKESTLHLPLPKPKPPLTLAGLSSACKKIVRAP
jgi:murein endopeptidase